jgi:hypothetical protein
MPAQKIPSNHIRLLAAQEAEMIEWTAKRAGIFGLFAHSAFAVMDTAVDGLSQDYLLFAGAWSTVRSFSGQALLAAMRQHRIQMNLCIRQVLEGVALAAYLMAHPRPQHPIVDAQGKMIEPKLMMTKHVYPWFKSEHPVENDRIKELKDHINLLSGHANLLATSAVFDYGQNVGSTIAADFFDLPIEEMVWANFYEVGEAISLAVQVILEANVAHNAFRLRRTIIEDLIRLEDIHRRATIQFNESYKGAD